MSVQLRANPAVDMRGADEHVIAAVRVALLAEDWDLASELCEILRSYADRHAAAPRASALADQAYGLLRGDVVLLARAADALRVSDRPLLWAGAAEDLGRALLLAGPDPTPGITELETAWQVYAGLGATASARRVEGVLRRTGWRRYRWTAAGSRPISGWASLTQTEAHVAQVIAAGRSNRQAAAALAISPNTVATHVKSIYRKLDVTSRVQLTRVVLDRGSAATR